MAVVDLESREHRDLLDLIDKLRSKGINQYVALPEIVVTGDQSAGKSSVLEAISGMSFPTKDNLCTRFATELILRRSSSVGVKISILPAACRPMPEQEKLKRFRPVVEQGSLELSHVVEQAKLVMGITPTSKAFRNDILRVEISGPSQPHLTMVDLPGLFQAGNSMQSDEDSETVTNIALRYMERPRSIILAVVSAKSDFALQQVTRLARRLDPEGRRTVGLITKPDTLDEGSESEAAYIRLAQNEDVRFKLGWHVLKNRDYKMTLNKATSQERDDAEREFFSNGHWAALDPSIVGVKALKPRLSHLLKDEILLQLPNLVKDVETGIRKCKSQLMRLGSARENIFEQRQYLVHISQAFSDLMKAAVDGFYNDPFFGSSKSEEGYQKRLRAVVQGLLIDFKDNMNEFGCTRHIVDSDDESDDEGMTLSGNKVLRSAYVEEVGELMNRNRGCELPGTFNPLIVGDLFFEQCKPWEDITEILSKKVLESVKRVAHEIIAHVTVESTAAKLGRFIRPAIQVLSQELEASFQSLLKPYQKIHPITYNEALTENVQKAQAERRRRKVEARLTKAYPIEMYGAQRLTVTRQAILEIFTAEEDVNMKLYGSSLAVDYLQAYYNVSLKKFIDDISTLGVECCLIQKLRSLFEPRDIYKMSDTEIQHLAEEDPATKLERSRLREKLNILDGCLYELRGWDKFNPNAKGI
ncbi:interferon-induced GTP-binding protein Mx [Metarhizium brunneum]